MSRPFSNPKSDKRLQEAEILLKEIHRVCQGFVAAIRMDEKSKAVYEKLEKFLSEERVS